jgi:hypothetical protein
VEFETKLQVPAARSVDANAVRLRQMTKRQTLAEFAGRLEDENNPFQTMCLLTPRRLNSPLIETFVAITT